jgi:2-dehydro-3-deoxy-D-arabinonate dehydratase
MKLYRTSNGPYVEADGRYYRVAETNWDALVRQEDLEAYLRGVISAGAATEEFGKAKILAPIGSQEVWAAGVTYYRSRSARMEESKSAGGGDFYDRVYTAERPEMFFKATPHRVAGPGGTVRVRRDSKWSIPEPELTLLVNPRGKIIGFTAGNDMSARDIEGENPLYLPQAKTYNGCCALGPCVLIRGEMLPAATPIRLEIERKGKVEFSAATTLEKFKRVPEQLVEFLFRDNSFPNGTFLMTGTGIVPPDEFALADGDRVRITIDPIGTLENDVVQGG